MGYRKSEFVAKTQFLSKLYEKNKLGKSKSQKETSTPVAQPLFRAHTSVFFLKKMFSRWLLSLEHFLPI